MENHLIHTNKNKPTQQFSTQKRTYRSERMKKYSEDCKAQTIPKKKCNVGMTKVISIKNTHILAKCKLKCFDEQSLKQIH